jgi:hypothetical protein
LSYKGNKPKEVVHSINVWQMLSNVLIASLNKGQFIAGIIFALLLVCILKMPSSDLSRLIFEIKQDFENAHIVGYIWGLFSTVGWYVQLKWQRKITIRELQRMSAERNAYQGKLLGEKYVKSSEDL